MVWLDGVRDLTTDWHFNHTGWRIARPRFLGIHYQSLVHCTIEVDCQALQAHQPPRRHPARSLGIHRAELPRPQRIAWEARVNLKVYPKVYLHIALSRLSLSLTMADRVAAPENPWSAAMDEDGSPWDGKHPILTRNTASNEATTSTCN